jgi:hypothetical protein
MDKPDCGSYKTNTPIGNQFLDSLSKDNPRCILTIIAIVSF